MKTKGKEVRVTFPQGTHHVLKEFARECGVPVAYLVRIATKNYLSKKGAFAKYGTNYQETK